MFGDRDCLPLSLSLKKSLTPNKSSKMKQAVISSNAQLAVALREWWHAKSEWFSAFTGEKVTNKHVALGHLYMVALTGALLLAGWLEGGAV